MQILLLATDEASKLLPLTDVLAAPMFPIVNRPTMAIAIEILARAGYKDILVSLYRRGGSIASFFGEGSRWGVHIDYVTQRDALGTAGAVRWAAQLLKETVLVLPADIVLDLDIEAALSAHRASGALVTLVLAPPASDQLVRPISVDADGMVSPRGRNSANEQAFEFVGAFLCEPEIVGTIPARIAQDTYEQWLPALQELDVKVSSYVSSGYWNPLNSMQRYHEAQRVFLYSAYRPEALEQQADLAALPRVRYPSIEGYQIAPGIWIGPNHMIHPSARLAPPLCIGEGSSIGHEVELGPEVILGPGVVVDDGATVRSSTIFRKTYVGQLVNIQNRVINRTTMIDVKTEESIQIVDPFLLATVTRAALSSGWPTRLFAILIASLLILLSLPVMVPIMLLVLVSAGRIIVQSERIGQRAASRRDGTHPQSFALWQLATHRADGSWSWCGRWLHAWQLDRLPELWNVVKGDLDLVGVRPLLPSEAASLIESWHFKRYECAVGFTGLWYVQSLPSENLDATLIADTYYAATHTWRGDLGLLLRTPIAWLRQLRSQPSQPVSTHEYYGQVDNVSGT
jgi:NDP-sugar pyrophosphorylase family protein